MSSYQNVCQNLRVGVLIATLLLGLFFTPSLEAQTEEPTPSTTEGASSGEGGGTTSPQPVDEWDEDDESLTLLPLEDREKPNSTASESPEPSLLSRLFLALFGAFL